MTLEQLCVHGWVMDRCSDCASPTPADSADLDLTSIEMRYEEMLTADRYCDSNRELEAARSSAHDVPDLLAEIRNLRLFRSARTAAPGQVVVDREAALRALDCPTACARLLRAALSPDPSPNTEERK